MPIALITGASRGIGAAFAQALAIQKYDLILVARNEAQLQALGQSLEQQYGITAKYIVKDLSQVGAAQEIFHLVQAWEMTVDLLINNAGFGDYGEFIGRDLSKFNAMIQVNITALVELTHLFLSGMQQRHRGEIINVSSIAGFLPLPYISVYAATKAFVLHFSEALWAENYKRGVTVMAVCPGPTQTEFLDVAEMNNAPGMAKGDQPDIVVKEALQALAARRSHVVTGQAGNRFVVSTPRFLPRQTLVKVLESRFRPPDTTL